MSALGMKQVTPFPARRKIFMDDINCLSLTLMLPGMKQTNPCLCGSDGYTPMKAKFAFMKRPQLIFIVAGLLLVAGAGLWVYLSIIQPRSWPQAEALVVSSRVINPGGPGQYTTELVLRTRENETDRDVTLVSSWTSASYDLVRKQVDKYVPGRSLRVAVNPSDPKDLRYDLDVTLMNMTGPGVLAILGLVFGGIGMWFMRPAGPRPADDSLTWMRVGWAFGLIGIVLTTIGVTLLMSDLAMLREWPEADAQVVAVQLVTASPGMQQSGAGQAALVDTEVTFRYTVGARTYTNRTLYGVASTDVASARGRMTKYAPDTRHKIRFRPGDPNVIRYDMDSKFTVFFVSGILLLMGLLFAGLGIMVRLVFARSRQGAGS